MFCILIACRVQATGIADQVCPKALNRLTPALGAFKRDFTFGVRTTKYMLPWVIAAGSDYKLDLVFRFGKNCQGSRHAIKTKSISMLLARPELRPCTG